jgi:long-chain acyl-CoA synthetase
MPDKTAEDYKLIDGVRYFATGDIGEMINGNLKIIDRKKDLVKLQGGEYVSLNKVETILKLLPFVDNCCVVADPTKSNTVCLIVPNRIKLSELVFDQPGNKITDSELMITHSSNQILTRIVQQFCEHKNIARFEIPKRVRFVSEVWLPESGMVTDSLKIKRKQIEKFYFQAIGQLYE